MLFLERRDVAELKGPEEYKIEQYLEAFLPFSQRFQGLKPRAVDRALWAFGKFVKPLVPEGVPHIESSSGGY